MITVTSMLGIHLWCPPMATGQVIESTEYEADDGERRYRNLQRVTASPGGGRYVQAESYYYWPTPVGKETTSAKKSRLRAKRRARANCMVKFDAEAHANAKEKRRKGARDSPRRPRCTTVTVSVSFVQFELQSEPSPRRRSRSWRRPLSRTSSRSPRKPS